MQDKIISVMGCGWLGFPLAERLVENDYLVKGSTTTLDKIQLLEQHKIMPYYILADPEPRGDNISHFFHADVLILNIPPAIRGGKSSAEEYIAKIRAIANLAAASPISHVIFVSSTSVYPDDARVVSEKDAGPAGSEAGEALLVCEKLLLEHTEFSTTILRMAGLYGPDRHPGKFLSGRKNISKPNAPVNMLHLEDAIGVTIAALEQEAYGEIFNVCASQHPTRKAYYNAACSFLDLPAPEFANDEISGKEVSNNYLKETLEYVFVFDDPTDGLLI